MTQYEINNEYFEWLFDLVCENRYSGKVSFRKLLIHLHDTEFKYLIQRDENRAADGVDLRRRFAESNYSEDFVDMVLYNLDGPCSVLEMMVALSIRCEEQLMDNPRIGDRTGQWFWGMIVNLGLGSMSNDRYSKKRVKDVLNRFLRREYEPNGKGGLFTVIDSGSDLREVEIWFQMCWYLNTIV